MQRSRIRFFSTGWMSGSHAKIRRAIVDKDVQIPEGMKIGYHLDEDAKRFTVTSSGIVVVPKWMKCVQIQVHRGDARRWEMFYDPIPPKVGWIINSHPAYGRQAFGNRFG